MNIRLEDYFRSLQGKRIAVLGIGVSNRPLVRLLLRHELAVTVYDKTPYERLDDEVLALEKGGAALCVGEDYLDKLQGDVIFRSPGIRPDLPAIRRLLDEGAVLLSEMELFFDFCPCRIFAVTGSDGKTTTTTIISKLLECAGYRVWVGGNIGTPLLDRVGEMSESDVAVVELSSFQLMTIRRSPSVAVVTNVAPNHLDIHKDMDEYIQAKKNIFCHTPHPEVVVLNADNDITASFASQVRTKVRLFSRRSTVSEGTFVSEQEVRLAKDGKSEPILPLSDIAIPGMHNVENYMAAYCAVCDFVTADQLRCVASSFRGVEHRIEFVREYHGVKIYNDSIASSPTRTIAGLHSFTQKVILIAGGYDKHIPFDGLGEEICRHVKKLVLCGATADAIEKAVRQAKAYTEEHPVIVRASDLKKALVLGLEDAQLGDVLTLSPACAAFDQFRNFMVRGDTFKAYVKGLK